MTLEPQDFWSYSQWLLRPGEDFLQSAMLQGIVLIILAIVLGLIVGYIVSAARYGPGEGFFAVARATRDLVREDLPRMSPRRILALARLAFKEAIRRKVLIVVGFFAVGLLIAGWFLGTSSGDPARLYISFVLTATNYLILFLALFISTFSIPADIKSKTIYTIVTKPVRATELVLGRMLGFIGVGTMMLAPMALLSWVFVTRGLDHRHEVVDAFEAADGTVTGETDRVRNHSHTFTMAAGKDEALTDVVRGHQHVVRRSVGDDGEAKFTVGKAVGSLKARVPSYGEVTFYDRRGERKSLGIDVGDEALTTGYRTGGIARLVGLAEGGKRMVHGYVEGGTLCYAKFVFDNVTPERYDDPDGIPIDLSLRVYRSWKGDIEKGVRGSMVIKHPDRDIRSEPRPFVVDEYKVDTLIIPRTLEVTSDGETSQADLFETLVSDDGRMEVQLRCIDEAQYLGVTRSAVYLRPGEGTFGANLLKAYGSIWLQMVMVIAFGVMFSTRLTGPVAMVATAACVLLGFAAEQIYDTRSYIDSNIERGGGPIEAMVRLVKQDATTTQLDLDSVTTRVIKGVDAGIVYSLDAIATALPNLPKMVGTAEYVASGFDIFGALLARHATATLGYFLIAFLVAYFLLKSREIAA